MARLGAGGFLIVIAAVTGFVGGAMAFTKKPRAKIILGTSAGLCLFAILAGFSDGIIYCLIYCAAAVLAHLDTVQKSISHEAAPRPAKININIDFRSIFQWLRDALTSSKYIHHHQLNKYFDKYILPGYYR